MKKLELTGIGLRAAHYQELLTNSPKVAWLEVHSENYFAEGGNHLKTLSKLRETYPVSLHGIFLSLGSSDGINWQYVKNLRELCQKIEPCLVSDHLSWSSLHGQYYPDLFPLPYTEEAVEKVVEHIIQIQDALNRQLLIENISSYIRYDHSVLSEEEFLVEIAKRSGCGILLDINNIYVNACNLGFDAEAYLSAIPPNLVHEFHLAGFSEKTINQHKVLIDTHNQRVHQNVWNLYRKAIQIFGKKPTIIEWDADIPTLIELYNEAEQAEKIMREIHD